MDCTARPSSYLGPLSVLPESRLEAGPLLPAPLLPQLDTALDLKVAHAELCIPLRKVCCISSFQIVARTLQ